MLVFKAASTVPWAAFRAADVTVGLAPSNIASSVDCNVHHNVHHNTPHQDDRKNIEKEKEEMGRVSLKK